ncbi:hypothetical protein VOLCADRAFT_86997 [Volvox carteri f. nagariensis]|uniref:Uncharacterized protein n=1 Tax=Volvox carteri f. nagariensis TaxID=3068 RepID=D8TJW7_VOLCA|nr:uncharacterized protein VOLCADRAFT_86997 [Volvox carteri f. nagariensis]EFJ52143.1 hypothetical protein VOLCADRAFT_86997 [Volvox carteri f. nagariensis]|eukprot:XP_002946917.1 hypothetical protein VOLCADRAFT_86997 [Volvox carteri f. nagariensis]
MESRKGLPPQEVLQLLYGNGDVSHPSLIDLRDCSKFMVSRLRGSYSVPLEFLVPRMFLLPDRATPLALVVEGPPVQQMVRGAASGGGAKEDIQLTAFLESRGWRVAFCIEATDDLWRMAADIGALEEGGCPLALKRRWPFRPSTLLMEQIDLIEELLVKARLQQGQAIAGEADRAGAVDGGRQGANGRNKRNVMLRMLDVGCGSGRDLAWLATRSSDVPFLADGEGEHDHGADTGREKILQVSWECVGLDSWHGALQRAAEILALGEVSAGPGGVQLHLAQIGPGTGELWMLPLPAADAGQLQLLRRYLVGMQQEQMGEGPQAHGEFKSPCKASKTPRNIAAKAGGNGGSREALELSTLGCFDLVVCFRFLERSFLQNMAGLLKPGGFILFSTFVDGPGLRAFGRPQGREHVLQADELATSFFGHKQGFKVFRDDVAPISDGRERTVLRLVLAVCCSSGALSVRRAEFAPLQLGPTPEERLRLYLESDSVDIARLDVIHFWHACLRHVLPGVSLLRYVQRTRGGGLARRLPLLPLHTSTIRPSSGGLLDERWTLLFLLIYHFRLSGQPVRGPGREQGHNLPNAY